MSPTGGSMVGTKKPCCQDAANLCLIEADAAVRVEQCQVCGCRHFQAFIDLSALLRRPLPE